MSATHKTVPTVNPAERALVVTVLEDSFASVGGKIPPQGTPYSSPLFKTYFSKDYKKEFSDFIYTGQVGEYGLGFARAKGPDDLDEVGNIKPFRSTWTKFGNHRWCPILKGLAFVSDSTFPLSTNIVSGSESGIATAPKNYVREVFIQEVNEGSRFFLQEFTSPFPFQMPRFPVPQPGRVSYQINGIQGSFEECLHDDIEIPYTDSTTAILVGSTGSVSDAKIPGQFFPRTNFRRRRNYVLASDQELRDGVWYMQRLWVYPPKQPRTTVQ